MSKPGARIILDTMITKQTRAERIKEIELLLTHPCDLGVTWRRNLVKEPLSYIGPEAG